MGELIPTARTKGVCRCPAITSIGAMSAYLLAKSTNTTMAQPKVLGTHKPRPSTKSGTVRVAIKETRHERAAQTRYLPNRSVSEKGTNQLALVACYIYTYALVIVFLLLGQTDRLTD